MRRFAPAVTCALQARYQASPAAAPKASKMETLQKILTGEVQFKNKALVKECNVEAMFGPTWKSELEKYAAGLPKDQQAVLNRQVSRLALTAYTTRELAQFAGDGPAGVASYAEGHNLCEGVRLLNAKGEAEFTKIVKQEATFANWTPERTDKFIAAVKAAKKQ